MRDHQLALSQFSPNDTIDVAAGTYHQQVNIEIPIQLVGAVANSVTLDGSGLDTQPAPAYGVAFVGPTGGGAVSVTGFTITNPFPYHYTSGEPMVVALADTNSSDSVTITNNVITEGTADANAGTDFPIGIDTFKNAARTTIAHNKISGTFQGALLEDNGPVSFTANKVKQLITSSSTRRRPYLPQCAKGESTPSPSSADTGRVSNSRPCDEQRILLGSQTLDSRRRRERGST